MAGEWNAMEVHKRELLLASQIKHSQETEEDVATRLQVELESLNQRSYLAGALHHLSLAFFISVVTILAVENRTRKQMRQDLDDHLEEVKTNVWEALGKRLLGPSIAAELEAVMKENASREDCSYVITFLPSNSDIPSDRQLVRLENSFSLRNLTGTQGKSHLVRASIIGSERFGQYPRFTYLKIGEEEQNLNNVMVDNDPSRLRKRVPLPDSGDGRLRISMGMELVYNRRDSESFITEVPIEGLHVTVVNQVPTLIEQTRLDLFHGSGVAEHPTDGTWHYRRALLPGQGFNLSWGPRSDTLGSVPSGST